MLVLIGLRISRCPTGPDAPESPTDSPIAEGYNYSGKIDKITTEWERHYLEKEFATDCEGIPEALANLGELWEVEVKGEGRPLTPMLFGCMDMVLAYPGGQEERKRRGQYPIELETIDFNEVHRKTT